MSTTHKKSTISTIDVYSNVEIDNNVYGEWKFPPNGDPYFNICGRAVWVLDVFRELETGKEFITLKYIKDIVSNETSIATIPRSWVSSRNLERLCEIGIDAQPHNTKILFQLIQKQEMTIRKTNRHTAIGFAGITKEDDDDIIIFKYTKTLGAIKSIYHGNRMIACNGTLKNWKRIIQDEVIGRASLEFATVLGLSASLVGYLGQFGGIESLHVNICGDSSSGKTTVAKLAVSTAGIPSFDGNTLLTTCFSTKNAMTKKVANNFGFPQVFDETSMFEGNFTDLIYTLASGREKDRLNKDCTMRQTENWATTIISTGEENILNYTKQNMGLSVRVLIFDSIKWTKDANHAERIQNGIKDNYGHAILKMAQYLLQADYNDIFRKLEFWRKKYLEQTTINDTFTERVSKKYAILLLTTSIAKKALGLSFSVKRILKLILENEAKANIERDLGSKAYSLFLEYVETNPNYFSFRNQNAIRSQKYWEGGNSNQYYGYVDRLSNAENIKGTKYLRHIVIAKTRFEEFCYRHGFVDSKIVLKNWKAKGLLKSEKDRLVSDRKISPNGNAIKCYIIRVSESIAPEGNNDI